MRDEAGEVLVLGAQAVERPRPQRRPDELRVARVHHQVGLRMGGQVGVHAPDHAELVGMAGDLGKELGDPLAALAVLAEAPGRAQQLGAVEPGRPARACRYRPRAGA